MPDDATPLYFELFNEINILGQLSSALLAARLPGGLMPSHFGVLNHLVRVRDGQTPLALAHAFQVPKTTMTHTLSGLARHGLVEMRPNPQDGRSKRVWLTAPGRALRDETIAALAPDIAALAGQFGPERVAAALPHLRDLRAIMDRMRDGDGQAPAPAPASAAPARPG
jgi:DNA-binding MarR family transcriptional regulator